LRAQSQKHRAERKGNSTKLFRLQRN
ncbi:hypothetical protein BAE44_0011346, partial [Dichanthelium oligosanthes]